MSRAEFRKMKQSPPSRRHLREGGFSLQTDATLISHVLACTLRKRLQHFLDPLLPELDAQIDRRLVRTFAATVQAIVQLRIRASSLLTEKMGSMRRALLDSFCHRTGKQS